MLSMINRTAARAIDLPVHLTAADSDDVYMDKLNAALQHVFSAAATTSTSTTAAAAVSSSGSGNSARPPYDIAYFIAGTDILVGDPLGGMSISKVSQLHAKVSV
jgi:hypothetical protein